MQNYKKTENADKVVFAMKLETVPGGGTVAVKDLGGNRVYAGSPLRKESNGLYHVIKTALVAEDLGASAKSVKVAKGHLFKVGDKIGVAGTANATISAIDKTSTSYDVITLSAALGAVSANGILEEIADTSKNAGYAPFGYLGETFDVLENNNHLQSIVVRGSINEAALACPVSATMKAANPLVRFV